MSEPFFQVGDKAVLEHQNLADGRLQGLEDPKSPMGEHIPVDYFAGSCWDYVRHEAMEKALYIRRQDRLCLQRFSRRRWSIQPKSRC